MTPLWKWLASQCWWRWLPGHFLPQATVVIVQCDLRVNRFLCINVQRLIYHTAISELGIDLRGHIMRNPERILLPPCVTALGIDDIGCDCFTINFDAEIFQRERRRLPLVFRSYRGVVDLVVD